MTCYVYAFEAHAIQRYILDSGRLAEMVGASELIESLTAASENNEESARSLDDLLQRASGQLGLQEIRYSRRAGGMFTAFLASRDDAERLRDLWSLLIPHYAPGLRFSHAVVDGADEASAAINARKALTRDKRRLSIMHPQATPPVRRSPRTGLPATDLGADMDEPDNSDNEPEWVDRASHMKSAGRFRKAGALLDKFNKPTDREWPTLFEPDNEGIKTDEGTRFPFLPDKRYVGIVHADGNDLGALVDRVEQQIREKAKPQYQALMLAFSESVAEATRAAAAEAAKVLAEATRPKAKNGAKDEDDPALPARPLVLGGDDLTIIVRGDCALNYTEAFIESFETHTGEAFAVLKTQHAVFEVLPDGLSACAGVAFVKATQPFYLAYDLAESLCDHAKQRGRAWQRQHGGDLPSSIVFARITSSFIARYDELIDQELSVTRCRDHTRYQMTLGAYGVGKTHTDQPRFAQLRDLRNLLARPDMARGPARKLLGLLHTDSGQANTAYKRWQTNLRDANKRHPTDRRLIEFDQALQALGIAPDADLPYRDLDLGMAPGNGAGATQTGIKATPLGDALAWLAVDGGMEENNDD